jgi:hypothetical protein
MVTLWRDLDSAITEWKCLSRRPFFVVLTNDSTWPANNPDDGTLAGNGSAYSRTRHRTCPVDRGNRPEGAVYTAPTKSRTGPASRHLPGRRDSTAAAGACPHAQALRACGPAPHYREGSCP